MANPVETASIDPPKIATLTTTTPVIVVLPDGRMDRKNAASYLGLSVKTLAMRACDGTGPKFIKRGRVWYRIQDLDDWMNVRPASSTAQARHLGSLKPSTEPA